MLDTWFSSALWPFSTMGWPDDTPTLRRYYPTDVLSTAADILFFWVARMIMMGMHFTGALPFRDVYLHPLIRDDQGRKFSKSKGIGIDPLDVMDAYGTDAMRFTLTQLAVQGRDIRFGIQVMEGGRAFVTKLWNAARFALMNLADFDATAAPNPAAEPAGARSEPQASEVHPDASENLYDRWIRHRMDVAIAEAHARARRVPLQRCRADALSLRLGRALRLVHRAGEAGAPGRRREPQKRAAQATLRRRAARRADRAAPDHALRDRRDRRLAARRRRPLPDGGPLSRARPRSRRRRRRATWTRWSKSFRASARCAASSTCRSRRW